MKKVWNYFKTKWGKSDGELILIMAIFAVTGLSFLFVKPTVFKWVRYDELEGVFLRIFIYILIIYPLYQVMLLIWGTLFGQFRFFWKFLGNMNRRLIPGFKKSQ